MNNCPFCENRRKEFLCKHKYAVNEMYFFEDETFSISSDLSPLTPGHLLIIPSHHYASFGEIEDIRLIDCMRKKSQEILCSSDLLFFEHGAVIEGQGGASIDHAHMHVMPKPNGMTAELIDRYITESNHVQSQKYVASHSVLQEFYAKKQPYIYYDIDGSGWVYPVRDIPHQFLRLMLQDYCSISYNWRNTFESDECRENVLATIRLVNSRK